MATAETKAVVRYIRNLAARQREHLQTDGQLLGAFLARNDQDAFEVIVRRHGSLVLRICRRVLGNLDDAEDAFQATFMFLAQQAASIRKKDSLASWLHGVAYRMATNARRAASRRRKHERKTVPVLPSNPAWQAAWREVQSIIDEEVQDLPEAYREPFIRCCLEDKCCAEVARELRLEEPAVRQRLSRARKLLEKRLARRGVSLAAVLTALAASESYALALPSKALLAFTAKLAAQVAIGEAPASSLASAKVIALVEGVRKAMLLSKLKAVVLVLLVVGLGSASVHGLLAQARVSAQPPCAAEAPDKQPAERERLDKDRQQPSAALAQAEAKDHITVRGRVLDPDGKPVGGAKLFLGGHTGLKAPTYQAPACPLRATSGADGRFSFEFAKSELVKADRRLAMAAKPDPLDASYQVLAVAEGYGCAWVAADSGVEELTLRLVEDAPVSGRILDADGKPVSGAKLTVTGVCAGNDRSGFAELVFKGHFADGIADGKGWVGPLPGQPLPLTTSAEGKFRLGGVGKDRSVSLTLEGRGIATAAVSAHGTSFEYQADLSRPIRGMVRDKVTGKPLAGVTLCWLDTYNRRYDVTPWRNWMTITDKDGRFELLGAPKSTRTGYSNGTLQVRPPEGQLYFQHTVVLGDSPGLDPMTVDIELSRGLTARGTVTDKATGQPLAGALVEYYPLFANPNVVKLPDSSSLRSEATTRPDGSYALTVLPGQGVIGVVGPRPDAYLAAYLPREEIKAFFKTPLGGKGDRLFWAIGRNGMSSIAHDDGHVPCNALVLIEPGEKEEILVKDVALQRPLELKGRVLGPDGKPLQGVTVYGLGPSSAIDVLKEADFTVRGLNPRERREVVFYHKDKSLGLFVKELLTDKAGPLMVTLQPCGSAGGRVVDQDGQPVANVQIHVGGIRQNVLNRGGYYKVTTDKDGRFHVEGLVPGVKYGVYGSPPPGAKEGLGELTHIESVEPGKRKDLGDVRPQGK